MSHKTNSGTWSEIIDDDLPWEVNKEESMWTLVPKEHVHVSFRSEIHVSIFLLPVFFKYPPNSQFVSKSTCLTCFGSIQVNTVILPVSNIGRYRILFTLHGINEEISRFKRTY